MHQVSVCVCGSIGCINYVFVGFEVVPYGIGSVYHI